MEYFHCKFMRKLPNMEFFERSDFWLVHLGYTVHFTLFTYHYTLGTMLIGFDASRAFVRDATGTENYSLNLLRALARIDRKNEYRVYLRDFSTPSLRDHEVAKQSRQKIATLLSVARNDKVGGGWPDNFQFKIIRPRRLWTQFGLALETWKSPVDVLFVPAHTLPILRRRLIFKSTTGSRSTTGITGFLNSLARGTRDTFEARDTRYIVTIHDLGVEYLPNYHMFPQRYYLDFASRYAAGNSDAIIAVSGATKNDLIKRYKVDSKKISVVSEGVDTGFFKPSSKFKVQSSKLKYGIRSPYILFVGTIQPRKNLLMLIEAFANLVHSAQWKVNSQKNKDYALTTNHLSLVVAGKLGWDYKEILNAPRKFGVEKNVKFVGRVDDFDLPALYTGAAAFVYPSLFEGFGLPILEALSCGCPVIASDIAPHREILAKIFKLQTPNSKIGPWNLGFGHLQKVSEAMVLVKPQATDEWARVLYQTISKYETRSTFSNKNLRIEAKFSWIEVAKRTLEVFERVFEVK